MFYDYSISNFERKAFCSDLQLIRRIRNYTIYRVAVNGVTLGTYAKSALNVLVILERLGRTEFKRVDRRKV
jgi:hypothetical protein